MTVLRRVRDTAQVGLLAAVERTVPRWPASWIAARQQQRLRSIIRHAYDTVPFYRQTMDERGLTLADFRTVADLERLPLIDGAMLQRDPDRFMSTAFDDSQREQRYTSGGHSSVVKFLYWERDLMMRRLAYNERDRAIVNRLVGRSWGQRHLFILPTTSISLVMRKRWDQRLFVPIGLAHREAIDNLTPLEEIVARIDAVRPDVIYSYGSFADVFVRSLIDRGLTIAAPQVWMYGGDTLPSDGRRLIEQHIGCQVYTTYQAIEGGRMGFQCERRDGIHLNTDLTAVRLIDGAGRTVAPGEVGEVVISNLHMRATVLLNYRLEDRAIMDPNPCPCGRSLPLLASLQGRVSDVLLRPDGQAVSAYAVQANCKAFLRSRATQLVSLGPGRVGFNVVPMTGVDPAELTDALTADIRRLMGPEMDVTVRYVEALPPSPNGKFPKVRVAIEAHGDSRPALDEEPA